MPFCRDGYPYGFYPPAPAVASLASGDSPVVKGETRRVRRTPGKTQIRKEAKWLGKEGIQAQGKRRICWGFY